jgi:hypothetical protein
MTCSEYRLYCKRLSKAFYVTPVLDIDMANSEKGLKSMQVRVSRETYQKLSDQGNLQDTFDTVIKRLLERQKEEEAVNQ